MNYKKIIAIFTLITVMFMAFSGVAAGERYETKYDNGNDNFNEDNKVVVTDDGDFITANDSGYVKRFNPDGSIDWEKNVAPDASNVYYINSNGKAYIGSGYRDYGFYKVDIETGSNSKICDDGNSAIGSPGYYYNGYLYILKTGGTNGQLGKFDLDSDTPCSAIWTKAKDGGEEWVTGYEDSIYYLNYSHVFEFDPSGNLVQTTDFASQSSKNIETETVLGAATDSQGNIIIGGEGSYISKLDPDGNLIWEKQPEDESNNDVRPFVNENDVIYAFESDGDIRTYDSSTGGNKSFNKSVSSSSYVTDKYDYAANGYFISNSHIIFDTGATFTVGIGSDNANKVVTADSGTPVPNATVVVTGVNHKKITSGAGETLEERAEELLNDAKNPIPSDFNADFDVRNDLFNRSDNVPVVHSADNWGLQRWSDKSQLGSPKVALGSSGEYVISLWDPGQDAVFEDSVDSDLPGKTVDGKVVLQKLGPGGDTISEKTLDLSTTVEAGSRGIGGLQINIKEHDVSRVNFEPGFYRVKAKESGNSYMIQVGDSKDLKEFFAYNLTDVKGDLSERAKDIQDYLDNGKFVRKVTTTDSNGEFSLSISEDVKSVSMVAFKDSLGILSDVSNSKKSMEDVRSELNNIYGDADESVSDIKDSDSGSIYLSTKPDTFSTPLNGVKVEVEEIDKPPLMGLNASEKFADKLENMLNNASMPDADKFLGDIATKDDLESLKSDLTEIKDASPAASDRYNEIDDGAVNPSLEDSIRDLERAISSASTAQSPNDVESNTKEDDGQPKLNMVYSYTEIANPDSVTVLVHGADGETKQMDDEYYKVNKNAYPRDDEVIITDYPMNGSVNRVEVLGVAGDTISRNNGQGIMRGSETVINPTVSTVPDVQTVEINTITPGSNDNVELDVSGENINQVKSAQAYGPDGSSISTNLNNGQVGFTTNGEGVHEVEVTVADVNGDEFTEVITLEAVENDLNSNPTLDLRKGLSGSYVVVSDGFKNGDISTKGEEIDAKGVLAEGEDSNKARVHLNNIASDTTKINIEILNNDEREVGRHMTLDVFTDTISKDAIVYREGQPIDYEDTSAGSIRESEGASVIETYTEEDGTATININANPTITEKAYFLMKKISPFKW